MSATVPSLRRPQLRVVLLLRSLGYVRLFDPVIRALLASGHHVHLLHERNEYTEREREWLTTIDGEAGFSWTLTTTLDEQPWSGPAKTLRRFGDYLYFLDPAFVGAPALIHRAEKRADPRLRRLLRPRFMRTRPVLRALRLTVELIERVAPENRALERELQELRPDVLVIAPHLMPGGRHSEYVKSARALGIPSCMCIASWDNLSSKQQLREVPERVLVWNRIQRDEAIHLHGVDPERIEITGAPSFDQWFERVPSPRQEFCARVGLEPERPYLFFVGGALFPGEMTEAEYVRDIWIPQLRQDERLRDLQILVRPHPRRLDQWAAVSFDSHDVAVWPPGEASMPVDEETRADYFDSIYHSAAVIGINTTAMIEAAVVGRNVYTVLDPAFAESQRGAFHFDYLLDVGGGLVRAAESYSEHCDDLAKAVAGDDEEAATIRIAFLHEFVRPHGLENPVLPRVVAAIEAVANAGTVPESRRHRFLTVLHVVLMSGLAVRRSLRRIAQSAVR